MRKISHEDLYSLSSYSYDLPQDRIAQSPANPRDSSRLLVWNVREDSILWDKHFRDIADFLRPEDLLILNDTRVIPARLLGNREAGGKCEVFLLRNLSADFRVWEALVRPARKIHTGSTLTVGGQALRVIDSKPDGVRTVEFALSSREEVLSFLDKAGNVPLPPYIHAGNEMRESYQTVFARNGFMCRTNGQPTLHAGVAGQDSGYGCQRRVRYPSRWAWDVQAGEDSRHPPAPDTHRTL